MRNPAPLYFLAAVQAHEKSTRTLMACAGCDPLELQVAVSAALEAGFVEATGKIHPSLRLTAGGWLWVSEQLQFLVPLFEGAPFLVRGTAQGGGAS